MIDHSARLNQVHSKHWGQIPNKEKQVDRQFLAKPKDSTCSVRSSSSLARKTDSSKAALESLEVLQGDWNRVRSKTYQQLLMPT